MKKYLVMICLSILVSQEHFIVEINETGESTLFIFEETITTLAIGDEIGIFDEAGIIDDSGTIGEFLVGSGVWDGNKLPIVGIYESRKLSYLSYLSLIIVIWFIFEPCSLLISNPIIWFLFK